MKSVRIFDLSGQKYDLTFEGDITINKIQEKLLRKYNYNTNRFYFCRSGKFLNDQSITKEIFNSETINDPIVIFNSDIFPDKSFPMVNNSFNIDFSRYNDLYNKINSINPILQNSNRIPYNLYFNDEREPISLENSLPYDIFNINSSFPANLIQSQNNQNINALDSDYFSDDDEDDYNTNHRYQNEEGFDTNHRYIDQDLNDSIILSEFEHSEIIHPEDETTYQEADLLDNNYGTNNYIDNLYNLNHDTLKMLMIPQIQQVMIYMI